MWPNTHPLAQSHHHQRHRDFCTTTRNNCESSSGWCALSHLVHSLAKGRHMPTFVNSQMLPCCSESFLASEPRSYVAGLACAYGTDGRAAHIALHSEATLQLVNEHHCCGSPIASRSHRPLPFQQVMSNSNEGSQSGPGSHRCSMARRAACQSSHAREENERRNELSPPVRFKTVNGIQRSHNIAIIPIINPISPKAYQLKTQSQNSIIL